MPSPAKILLCLDTDPQPSVFDSVVAIDSGIDHLLRHGGVVAGMVRDLVHGAMFTRGGDQLRHTALFIGGSDVDKSQSLLAAAKESFFGPVRISAMLDPSGANTTAAAAVIAASRHLTLGPEITATVLAATGPVGQRVVRLLASEGVQVRAVSRRIDRARAVCDLVSQRQPSASLLPFAATDDLGTILADTQLVIAAGAAGIELLDRDDLSKASQINVAIDLNAVPPAGIHGIEARDKAAVRAGKSCYGALGIGGLKMKIHKAALASLFTTNDLVLDAEEIYALGKGLS
jgi:methylenetetrahydrofolate/methylenetetrahydromethanopterin dehydrogenase (NADP+)